MYSCKNILHLHEKYFLNVIVVVWRRSIKITLKNVIAITCLGTLKNLITNRSQICFKKAELNKTMTVGSILFSLKNSSKKIHLDTLNKVYNNSDKCLF